MRQDDIGEGRSDALVAAGECALRVEPAGVCVRVRPGESVLEAAARAGWALPSSCRNGTCRACLCRLISGEIRYRVAWPGLSAEEKRAAWMLPCVALPVADVVVEQPTAMPAIATRLPGRGF